MPTDVNPVESILAAAVEIGSDAERRAYVEQACGGDEELKRRALQMIEDHFRAGSFLESGAGDVGRTTDQAIAEQAGTVIGPYKLLQQIGEGGFGVVFMAEQTTPVRRRVALKILKPGMDTKHIVARFEAERQALAIMDHPNIARVFDGGATPSGRPYFVMELVKGVPITQFCDDEKLSPRQRLELFVSVCQAVQHAHHKGIIHRDLKPTNVLVSRHDSTPVVKVIDFGVAKALGQELTDKTLFTGIAQMVGTPLYMSPEQAGMSDLDVDTRSDIYSLGVLLYELLTGTTPFDRERFRKAAYDEIRRIIREEDPPKPSTRLSDSTDSLPSISAQRQTEPAKLTKLVRGELDWIVMKALEKDRNRRYETANGFAMDVQRYLADEAVQACPPSAMYRLHKFARRNKTAIGVAGMMLFFLLLLGSGAGWALRDREAREQEIAQETVRRLALTEEGIRQALDRAALSRAELHALLKRPGGVQELLNQPARWELSIKTAQAELAQARRLAVRAEGSLDPQWTQAMDKLEQQLTSDQADYDLGLRLEKIRLDKATWVEVVFDFRKAANEYPKAFAGLVVLTEDAAAVAARLRSSPINEQLVAALDDWAMVASVLRNEPLAEQLLAVARLAAPDPAWADRVRQLKSWRDQEALGKLVDEAPVSRLSPQMLVLVGWRLSNQSSLRESWLRRAQAQYPADFWLNFELALALAKTQPLEASGFYRVALAVRPLSSAAYNNLGGVLCDQKKLPEAVAAYRKAIEIDPKHAYAYHNLGSALHEQKKLPEAVAAYREAIKIDPKFAWAYNNLGVALKDQGQLDEAIACFRTCIELGRDTSFIQFHLGVALERREGHAAAAHRKSGALGGLPSPGESAYLHLGDVLERQGKLNEAIDAWRRGTKSPHTKAPTAHYNIGCALRTQGKHQEAATHFRKAIELDPKYAAAHVNLGHALVELKLLDEAIVACRRAIELAPKEAKAHNNLGRALHGQKKFDEAVVCFRKAIELDPKDRWPHHNLSLALFQQKKPDEAIKAVRSAIELDPKLAPAHNTLGNILKEQGKLDQAIESYRKGIEVAPRDFLCHVNLALTLDRQKKWDEALAAYRKAVAVAPDHPAVLNGLAWFLATTSHVKLRNPKEAVELARRAVKLDPTWSHWNTLMVAALRAGEWQEALRASDEAARHNDKGSAQCWNGLGLAMIRWQLGQKEEARKAYDRVADEAKKYSWLDSFRQETEELLGITATKPKGK